MCSLLPIEPSLNGPSTLLAAHKRRGKTWRLNSNSPSIAGPDLLLSDFHQSDLVHTAKREREVAVFRHADVPHHATAGWYRPRLKLFGRRIEHHDGVRLHAG